MWLLLDVCLGSLKIPCSQHCVQLIVLSPKLHYWSRVLPYQVGVTYTLTLWIKILNQEEILSKVMSGFLASLLPRAVMLQSLVLWLHKCLARSICKSLILGVVLVEDAVYL